MVAQESLSRNMLWAQRGNRQLTGLESDVRLLMAIDPLRKWRNWQTRRT